MPRLRLVADVINHYEDWHFIQS